MIHRRVEKLWTLSELSSTVLNVHQAKLLDVDMSTTVLRVSNAVMHVVHSDSANEPGSLVHWFIAPG